MDATSLGLARAGSLAAWLRAGLGAAVGLLWLAALLLLARRLAGALLRPLPPAELFAAGGCLALVAAGVRITWGRGRSAGLAMGPWYVPGGLTSAAVAVCGAALSFGGTPAAWLALFWIALVICDVWTTQRFIGRPLFGPRRTAGAAPSAVAASGSPLLPPIGVAPEESPPDEEEWQLVRRVRDEAGRDIVAGRLRADLAAGERAATLHVSFCPPFERLPQLHAEQTAGPEARLQIAQVLPFGARLELKLPRAATESTTLWVEVVAVEGGRRKDEG